MRNIMETGEKELAWEKPQRKPIDSTGHGALESSETEDWNQVARGKGQELV